MGSKEKIGLYFGSFNPVHIGHLHVANSVLDSSDLDRIMFVITPLSPDKVDSDLLDHGKRLEILSKIKNDNFIYSDIEFTLPQPNYTHVTLRKLREDYPDFEFSLILGTDNVLNLHNWVDIDEISQHHKLYIVKREGYNIDTVKLSWYNNSNYELIDTIPIGISSTMIRNKIKNGESVQYLVPEEILESVVNNYYR